MFLGEMKPRKVFPPHFPRTDYREPQRGRGTQVPTLAPISLPAYLVPAWHAQAVGCMAALREMREGEEEEEGCSKDIREGYSSRSIVRKRTCTTDRKNGCIKLTDAQKRRGKRIQSTVINHMKQN